MRIGAMASMTISIKMTSLMSKSTGVKTLTVVDMPSRIVIGKSIVMSSTTKKQ